jgi:hypothetical protein
MTGTSERHEVVLVTATADGNNSVGTERVIRPSRTMGAFDSSVPWYPYDIIWSADGTRLVYFAWGGNAGYGQVNGPRILAVSIESARPSIVITDQLGLSMGAADGTPWVPLQQWSEPIAH